MTIPRQLIVLLALLALCGCATVPPVENQVAIPRVQSESGQPAARKANHTEASLGMVAPALDLTITEAAPTTWAIVSHCGNLTPMLQCSTDLKTWVNMGQVYDGWPVITDKVNEKDPTQAVRYFRWVSQ